MVAEKDILSATACFDCVLINDCGVNTLRKHKYINVIGNVTVVHGRSCLANSRDYPAVRVDPIRLKNGERFLPTGSGFDKNGLRLAGSPQ
jgi:hypothetical protein